MLPIKSNLPYISNYTLYSHIGSAPNETIGAILNIPLNAIITKVTWSYDATNYGSDGYAHLCIAESYDSGSQTWSCKSDGYLSTLPGNNTSFTFDSAIPCNVDSLDGTCNIAIQTTCNTFCSASDAIVQVSYYTTASTTTPQDNAINFGVGIAFVIATVLVLDLIRRLFTKQRNK